MLTLPTVIIAGAPKCGTTSLFQYLSDHPLVCATNIQETRFLIDNGYPLYDPNRNINVQGLKGYERLFSNYDPARHRVLLEATPDYLYQQTALSVISTMPSLPTVIFLLRRPSRRVYSLFRFAQKNMQVVNEGMTFSEFVRAAQQQRFSEDRPILRYALAHSRYVDYLSDWVEILGRDRTVFLLFEHMASDPVSFMQKLALRIGLESDFYSNYEFAAMNRTGTVRNRTLHQIRHWLKGRDMNFSWLGPLENPARQLYRSATSVKRPIAPDEDEQRLMAELDLEFKADNKRLAELIDVDLAIWEK